MPFVFKVNAESLKVSLKATGALICIGKGKVIIERPSMMTLRASAGGVMTINGSTGGVVNHAPNGVITLHPVGSNIVTSCRAATIVVGCCVGRTGGGGNFFTNGPCMVIYIPSNVATIRRHTIISTAHRTKTHSTCAVRRPFTTTVKTGLPI